jgi:hypothetical protein
MKMRKLFIISLFFSLNLQAQVANGEGGVDENDLDTSAPPAAALGVIGRGALHEARLYGFFTGVTRRASACA